MNNILSAAARCTGCTSCMSICAKQAIQMRKDELGFYYPKIEGSLCVDCGRCVGVCPVLKLNPQIGDSRIKAYYGSVIDGETVKASSSGGAFSFMAEYVLENGGMVCGAVFDYENMEVIYSSTDSCALDAIRRSKYVASMPQNLFATIKEELNKNRLVFFCGLPCHVDGLKSFLIKDYENLITCDFICGGVASPQFFQEHISFLEKKYKSKVVDINFRAKLNGWKEHSIKIRFANNEAYSNIARYDSFFQGYFEKFYQRDCCYECQYRLRHVSDIIIADYWGGISKGRANDTGVSMLIVNSKKGNTYISKMLNEKSHAFIEMPVADSNYVFKTEAERYEIALCKKYGFEKAVSKTYHKGIWMSKLKLRILKIIRKKK